MSREHERLDRLLALLASEAGASRDLRDEVMRRLAVHQATRRRRRAAGVAALLLALGAGSWIGWQSWQASRAAEDLGAIGRRGAEWLVPATRGVPRATPVKYVPTRRPGAPMAQAPWGRT